MNTYLQFQLSPWYANVSNCLATRKLPAHLSKREKRKIIQQSSRYCWIDGHFFYTGPDLEIRRCVREDEIFHILKACNDEPCGGHFADRRKGHKTLRMGYYWLTLFKDAKKYVQSCDNCQRMANLTNWIKCLFNHNWWLNLLTYRP